MQQMLVVVVICVGGNYDSGDLRGRGSSLVQAPVVDPRIQGGAEGLMEWTKSRSQGETELFLFSLRSVFFHTLPAFHIFLSLAVSVFCSHIAALRCSAEPVIPVPRSRVWKLQLRSHHPFALLCSPSHLPYPKYPLLYL